MSAAGRKLPGMLAMDDGDQSGDWLPVQEAAMRLGTTESGIRNRIKRSTLRHRRGNDGKVLVFVPLTDLSAAGRRPDHDEPMADRQPDGDELAASLRQVRDELEAWRRQAEERGTALAEARAEARLLREGWERERENLERERARGEKLEALLAELARRPWWRKLLG
jgi:hypothetical protein